MTVKTLLACFNIGKSTVKKVTVVNRSDSNRVHDISIYSLAMGEYGELGGLRVITFAVEGDQLHIYAR